MEVRDFKVVSIKHLTNSCSFKEPTFGKIEGIQVCVIRMKDENCFFKVCWQNNEGVSDSFIFNRTLDAVICIDSFLFVVDKLLVLKLGIEEKE